MAFPITDLSLRSDRGLFSLSMLIVGVALVAAWTAWAIRAHVTRYEVSDSARLEVTGAASPIEAGISGSVTVSHLVLGQAVSAGQILLELDNRDQQWELRKEQARHAQLGPQLAALDAQVESETVGQMDEEQVLVYSQSGAEAQVRQARIDGDLAAAEAQRAEQLRAAGLISEADVEKSRSAAKSKTADLESLQQAVQRLSPELKVRAADRTVKTRQIVADIAKLQADIATSSATMDHLRYEIDRRNIRASVSGTLTECAVFHPGARIIEGQQVGVILPQGMVQVIADFDPAAAFGILHADQQAEVRLNGFPWAQFGVLHASISRVAGEIRNGKVRVELSLRQPNNSRIPLQHGLPGTVEVEVEQVTPAALLLRSAGQTVGVR